MLILSTYYSFIKFLKRYLSFERILILLLFLFFFITSNASNVKSRIDSLKTALKSSTGVIKCETLLKLSSILSLQDPIQAEFYSKEALKQSIDLKDSLLIVKSKINLALSLRYQRKFQEVLDILNPTLAYINRIQDKTIIAEILNNIGVAHFQLGHNNQSLSRFFQSLKIQEELSDQKGMSVVLNNLGNYYFKNKNYEKALEFYAKCMTLDSTIGDKSGLAFSFYNIGKVYQAKEDYFKAKKFLSYSSNISTGLNNPAGKVYIYYSLAEILANLNKGDSALFFLSKSDSVNTVLGLKEVTPNILFLKGTIYQKQNQFDLALPNLIKANDFYYELGDSIKFIEGLINVGNLYDKISNYSSAKIEYQKALKFSSRFKLNWLKADALIGLASIYKHDGDINKTEEALWKYVQLKDSLISHARDKINAEIEIQKGTNELEKKIDGLQKDTKIQNLTLEKERTRRQNLIILISVLLPLLSWLGYLYYERRKAARFLAEKNDQINQQNEELNAINDQLNLSRQKLIRLNQTKDKFFSIVAHDLKSPLVSLRSYLYAIRNTPPDNQLVFNNQVHDIEKSLNTILELLNNLLFWALSQEDKIDFSPIEFNLHETIMPEIELANYLAKGKNITLEYSIPLYGNAKTDRNMLLFIIRNLVSNALKHTPENGKIKVEYANESQTHTIYVIDNGSGIEPLLKESLFDLEKKIVQQKKGTGLGLMLCREFIETMGGTINVQSEVGKGSTFIVSFPDSSC